MTAMQRRKQQQENNLQAHRCYNCHWFTMCVNSSECLLKKSAIPLFKFEFQTKAPQNY